MPHLRNRLPLLMTTHRRSPDSPPSLYLGENQKRGWFTPSCSHGSTEWEGASPQCGDSRCVRRWTLRYVVPLFAFLIGIVILGMTVWRVPWIDCPPGSYNLGSSICVAR